MNANKISSSAHGFWLWFVLLFVCTGTLRAEEESFPVFKVGTRTYTNVTVTTKAKKYVFILHSTGMANIKVADLSPELQQQLGYVVPEEKNTKGSGQRLADWTKKKMATLSTPQIRAAEMRVQETWQTQAASRIPNLQTLDRKRLIMIAAIGLFIYLFFSYCNKMICEKAGKKPGILVWLPIAQVFPMFEAANMSPLWILLFPIAPFVWSFKIATACGKNAFVGFLLLVPGISFFAYLYLAFSDGAEPKEKRVVEVMCLETA